MARILVVAPQDVVVGSTRDDVAVARYSTVEGATEVLAGATGPVVLCSDGLHAEALERVAAAVEGLSAGAIEVQGGAWDGFAPSPLSSACRGVIAGFGAAAGIEAAVRLLRREATRR